METIDLELLEEILQFLINCEEIPFAYIDGVYANNLGMKLNDLINKLNSA